MADDWGCTVELFGDAPNSACPVSMTELVDVLTSKQVENSNHKNEKSFSVSPIRSENVEIVPCLVKKNRVNSAPKILKKKNKQNHNNNDKDEASVKRVTFEVEKLLAQEAAKDDREKARERMIVSLGGNAPKKGYTNYKRLREDIINAKSAKDGVPIKRKCL